MKKVTLILLVVAATAHASQKPFHLEIGDPERKDREVPLTLDAVTDTWRGDLLSPSELVAQLGAVRLLFIGETHTSIDSHRAQLRILEELHRAGRRVLIGLEMFPYTHQAYLDDWSAGRYTEDGFVHFSNWYEVWSHNWLYYRDIFVFARDAGLPMYAMNAPREVIRAVRQRGFQDLSAEEAAHIPTEIDTTDAEHGLLFRSYFDENDPLHAQMDDEAWNGMVRAQATWDATMAWNAVRILDLPANAGPETILVVLIGSGHVAYGLGIERQARQWCVGEMASVVTVATVDDEDEPVESVRASYADYIWGLPAASDPLYPVLGASTSATDGDPTRRRVIHVSEKSPAEDGGFLVGDVLVAMDGVPIDGKGVLGRLMGGKRWGDRVSFVVRRDGEDVELDFHFRRRGVKSPGDGGE